MGYLHTDLGSLRGGEIVEITLRGSAVNVRLMDSSNFSSYKSGRQHRYIGGQAKRSPVRLQVPRSGHWHVAIDAGGFRGRVRAGVRVFPGALAAIREPSLASVPSLLQGSPDLAPSDSQAEPREFDVFISHASEDKNDVVRPLATALQSAGLKVWYDEFELRIGDSLRRKIDMGLARSRFGLVVFSKAFFKKNWTNYELDGLVTKAVTGEQVLLPIWHNVTKQEVISYSPSLADKLARSTATHTVEEIAKEIVDVIRGTSKDDIDFQ